MNFYGIIAVLIALGIVAYWGSNTFFKARASRELMENETPFSRETGDLTVTMLVLGDSTGVGVGAANAEETVAGRVANYIQATHVENYAKSGALVEDLPEQRKRAKLDSYDLILIHVGGNDILNFKDAKTVSADLGDFIDSLPIAPKTIFVSAGNVGGATTFPEPIRPFHTWTTLSFHKEFTKLAAQKDITYVNLYDKPEFDPFVLEPTRYLAADGLHPSSEGYAIWFEKIKVAIDE
jgi:lysophospholipase L1-like esterase